MFCFQFTAFVGVVEHKSLVLDLLEFNFLHFWVVFLDWQVDKTLSFLCPIPTG